MNGIFKCKDKRCKICRLYLQECTFFQTANDTKWEVRSQISCNSRNVVYYLICCFCNTVSYVGKTDDLRARTNNHITGCRYGKVTDQFDLHVHTCGKKRNSNFSEPNFRLFVFMKMNDYNKLRNYERIFHQRHYDTLNRWSFDTLHRKSSLKFYL